MQEFLIDIEEEHDNCVWQRDMCIDKIIDSKIF